MASDAVGLERVSRIVGYKIKKGTTSNSTPNLPQRIAILAEANEVNQSTLDLTPTEVTSPQQAGSLYGYGSPVYQILRILKPIQSDGVGGIPIVVYPQAKAVGSTSKIYRITPSGTATGNGTHYVRIAGRDNLDGLFYAININTNDTTAIITGKIEDAVNAVLGSPVGAISYDYNVLLESKWRGETAEGLTVTVDTGENALGITYAVVSAQTATGTPSISAALELFSDNWNTIVINSYGTNSTVMTTLEDFNGIPDPNNPTGRYSGIIMKPFIALTGSVADNDSAMTDLKLDEVTIAICPAPLSPGLPMEAAANMCVLYAVTAQNQPQLDVGGQKYPDMPVPTDAYIGTMSDYDNRDSYVKKGNSTVSLNAGRYQVEDFVTTYHAAGEIPPQFRYCRNLNLDFNVRYGYYLLELINVVDHVIANDDDVVTAQNVVKPKMWKQVLEKYADDLTLRALIADPDFMKDSIVITIGATNADRLETFFRYKRTGVVRIASTTAEANFNFGNV